MLSNCSYGIIANKGPWSVTQQTEASGRCEHFIRERSQRSEPPVAANKNTTVNVHVHQQTTLLRSGQRLR